MTISRRISAIDFAGEHAGLIFLALLPIAVWIINPNVLGNVVGDVDTWFYFGNFMALGQYTGYDFNGVSDYYQTRLPYIIPGYIVFHLFSLAWAKAIFAYLCYATTISSMFYSLRAHMAERTAALVLMVMASDIFFTRAINWNYVDEGAIVYQALTLAAITATRSAPTSRKMLWIGIAAFCFTCSVICHLGVALTIIPIAGYAAFCLEPTNLSKREILKLFGAALAGTTSCLIIFGFLNVIINRGDFFFLLFVYKVGKRRIAFTVGLELTFPARAAHGMAYRAACSMGGNRNSAACCCYPNGEAGTLPIHPAAGDIFCMPFTLLTRFRTLDLLSIAFRYVCFTLPRDDLCRPWGAVVSRQNTVHLCHRCCRNSVSRGVANQASLWWRRYPVATACGRFMESWFRPRIASHRRLFYPAPGIENSSALRGRCSHAFYPMEIRRYA